MVDTEKIERKAKLNGESDAFANEDGGGLTKREWFAGMALSGMSIVPNYSTGPCNAAIAERALAIADRVLQKLAESDGAK
jgi:hypothetical protein